MPQVRSRRGVSQVRRGRGVSQERSGGGGDEWSWIGEYVKWAGVQCEVEVEWCQVGSEKGVWQVEDGRREVVK